MVKKLQPKPIYGPEDIGTPINLTSLQSAITRACHELGLPVEVLQDEMREGGMFSNKLPCIVVRHKTYKSSYFQHVIVQKTLFNSCHITVYLAGKSHNLFKMGMGEEAYGQWGTKARIFGLTKGKAGDWLPSFGELVVGHAGKKAARQFNDYEKPYYERVEFAIGYALPQARNIPVEPPKPPVVEPPKVDDNKGKIGSSTEKVDSNKGKVEVNKTKIDPNKGKADINKGKADTGKGKVGASRVTPPPQPKTTVKRPVSPKIIGIDLGTTNSCVAVLECGKPVMIPGREGDKLTPSVVTFDKEGKRIVGKPAKNQAALNPKRTVSSIKRQMGSAYRFGVDGRWFNPQQISAMILSKLKADAESYLGMAVENAVITVPAYFTDEQRQATKDAGEIAGLKVLRIINEPTAAAMAYGLNQEKQQKVMVYDLGGGTFDVSILDIGDGVVEVLATSGDSHLGGDDFDGCLVDHMIRHFKQEHGIDLFGDLIAMQRMKNAAEKAKIELSTLSSTAISLPYLHNHPTRGPMHLSMSVTRSEFNEMIREMVQRTQEILRKTLADANLTPADISKVLLVGGSTRIPAVQDAVKAVVGDKLVGRHNPDECVALGAAVQGGVLSGDVCDTMLLDVIPISLGVETHGGVFVPIISKNTTIPTGVSRMFTTYADNQTSVEIRVYQGEEKDVSDNKFLGCFKLGGIIPAAQGVPKIQVTFHVGSDGILRVTARDMATNRENSITVSGSSNMSRREIDNAIVDARRYEAGHKMAG